MSCIQRILAVKGDKEYLVFNESTAVEGGGNYRGFDYLITFRIYGFRCGYVAIPDDNDIPGVDFSEDYPDFDVHGGITFNRKPGLLSGLEKILEEPACDDRWIGFDAAHSDDLVQPEKALFIFNDPASIKELNLIIKNTYENGLWRRVTAIERTHEYMESECMRLIDQLIMHKEHHNMVGG